MLPRKRGNIQAGVRALYEIHNTWKGFYNRVARSLGSRQRQSVKL